METIKETYFYYIYRLEPGTLQFKKRSYLVKESCGDAENAI